MRLRAGVASDCGLVRPANEDSFLLRLGLYAVCDGMGGARAGEVASQMACLGLLALDPASAEEQDLRRAIVSANKAITGRSASEEHLMGMGTTITVALAKPDSLIVAHVGDSRAYVLHAGELAQITDDHSWVGEMVRRGEITLAQAAIHPHRSVITRALGTDGDVTPDTTEVPLTPGDRVLLCSDGLTGMVSDQVIAELMQQGTDPQMTADALVMAALAGGGEDNVTAIVIHAETDQDPAGGEDGGRAIDDRILFGPSDRGASVAPPSHRSRRAAAAVRERLGRRVIPLARPVAAPLASAEAGPAAEVAAEPVIAETAPALIEVADLPETPVSETPVAGTPAEPSVAPAAVTPALEAETKPAGEAARARKRRRWIYWTVVVVLVLAIAIGGLAWYNSTVYYVGDYNGKVALFNGLPASVLGIDLSSVYELSTVQYESLTPYQRGQVDSHDLLSKTDGQQFLRTLPLTGSSGQ
jgi:serine/threonine protein phosphatase PrpC